MTTQTAPRRPKSVASQFRTELLDRLHEYCQEHYHATPGEVQVPALDLALQTIRQDPDLSRKMPTREAFLTQYEQAFKAHLRRVEQYVAEEQVKERRLALELDQLKNEHSHPSLLWEKQSTFQQRQYKVGPAVALNGALRRVRTMQELQFLVGVALSRNHLLIQGSTDLPVHLHASWPSSQHPGEEWGEFRPAQGLASTCQFRCLADHYNFRPCPPAKTAS